MSYAEQLLDQRWQKKRLELLNAAGWRCQSMCCSNEQPKPTLHVHHRAYLRNTYIWDYPAFVYQVLCDDCHKTLQKWMEETHLLLAKNQDLETALLNLSRQPEDIQQLAVQAMGEALAWDSSEVVKSLFSAFNALIRVSGAAWLCGQTTPKARFLVQDPKVYVQSTDTEGL